MKPDRTPCPRCGRPMTRKAEVCRVCQTEKRAIGHGVEPRDRAVGRVRIGPPDLASAAHPPPS